MMEGNYNPWSMQNAAGAYRNIRDSRKLLLVIVFLSLLLDNILLTVVVPIIPDYLWSLEHHEDLDYYTAVLYNDSLTSMLNLTTGKPLGDLNTEVTNQYLPTEVSHIVDFNHSSILLDDEIGPSHIVPHAGIHGNLIQTLPSDETSTITISAFMSENSEIGWLLSSKAIVQLICNPFIGPITNRYGSSIPMFVGLVILCVSNIMYAFGESYALLFIARAVQGIGSACIAIAGMTVLAIAYPDDNERSNAMGISMSGISLGVLIGYPYGGFMNEFLGKSLPFVILTIVTLIVAGLQVWAMRPVIRTKTIMQETPLHVLLCDPYILAASGAILFPEMAMAMLEPTLPLWLLETMQAKKWQLGTIFIPDSVGYFIGTTVFAFVAHKIGRWICTGVALMGMGICLMCIPLATHLYHLIVPHFGLGLALGMVDVAIMPMLAYLVDKRHHAAYGSVYAIAQVSISLGFALGPSLGGQIVKCIGFPWLIRGMAMANIIFCPVAYFLRDPPGKEENKSILMSGHPRSAYTDDEENFGYQKLEEE